MRYDVVNVKEPSMHRAFILLLVIALAACGTAPNTPPTLSPTLTPLATPNPLTLGQSVTATLSPTDPFRDFAFTASTDQPMTAVVRGTDVSVSILDPAGNVLEQGIGTINTTLPANGVYNVRVRLLREDITREFTLTVLDASATPTPPPTNTPEPLAALGTIQTMLTSTAPAFGAFNTPDERHVYSFQGAAGTFAQIDMRSTSGTLDPLLVLYSPDFVPIALDDNSGTDRAARLNNVELKTDGIYAVVAYGDGFTGTYELTLATSQTRFPIPPVTEDGVASNATATPEPIILTPTLVAGVPGNRLEDHTPILSEIARPGEVDRYIIQADAEETFTIGVTPLDGGLIPEMEMSAPSGSIAASQNIIGADGDLVIGNYTAPSTGAYIVFVTGANNSTGSYRLSYGRGGTRETIRKAETFADRTYDSSITRRAVREDWYLRLNAGDMITASATSLDGRFDPVLSLIAPDGSLVIEDNNSGGGTNAQLFNVRAAVGGVYRLRVTSANPQVFGVYSVIWRYIEAAPTPTPPLLLADVFTVDDTITPYEPRVYPVQANFGEQLRIDVEAAPGSGLDTVVDILNANGEIVASDDDSGGNLNPSLLVDVPADGLYQIRVRVYDDGSRAGGGFVLRVRRTY